MGGGGIYEREKKMKWDVWKEFKRNEGYLGEDGEDLKCKNEGEGMGKWSNINEWGGKRRRRKLIWSEGGKNRGVEGRSGEKWKRSDE